MVNSISVEAHLVIGPVGVVDLVAGSEDELLIRTGRITCLKGEKGTCSLRSLVIKTKVP